MPTTLFSLIKMYLNEGNCKFRRDRYLSDTFLLQNGLKEGNVLSPLFLNFTLE
jgi:hypothetical protein